MRPETDDYQNHYHSESDRDHFYHHNHHYGLAGFASSIYDGPLGCFFNSPWQLLAGHVAEHDEGHHAPAEILSLPAESQFGLIAEVGGHAFAAGTETVVSGSIVNTIEDMGSYTIAFGDATFGAAAHSPGHGGALAGADTFLSVAGADIVIEFTHDKSVANGCNPWAQSETQYLAIDIHGWTPSQGTIALDAHKPLTITSELAAAHIPSSAITGNIANVIAMADALGTDTFASTITHALTVENHFSMVSGAAIVAA